MQDFKKAGHLIGEAIAAGESLGEAKYGEGLEPESVELHTSIHVAVRVAKQNGVERSSIERRLGLYRGALTQYLSGKPDQVMKLPIFARMLFSPSVLGSHGHQALLTEIALRNGGQIIAPGPAVPQDGVLEESLDIGDASGAVQSCIRDAIHPDSDGGTTITRKESEAISGCARVLIDEALCMIPHVEPALQGGA